uniref:coiled-coil domain-containing protein 62 n=1 Tax=Jaculus jaculus TaxID=51337 RepID=UPI001E1B3E39|nr:coiled-coil domain-containing protein 62 [Jaculus jaculus]
MNPSATFPARRQNIGSKVETSTIERQRKELQLLIGELKDRDKELNDMVAVHQRQLLAWEEDRQKVLTLEERCSKLEEDLNEKTTENNDQREEIIRLKQEKSCLHDELVFTAEREKRKDELLDIAKSKQERTNSELHNLRQIYVKQQSDLQFLNFNVENSHELIQIYDAKMEDSKTLESSKDMCLSDLENSHPKVDVKREKNPQLLVKDQKFEVTLAQQNRTDKSSCVICKEKILQDNNAFGEKSVTTFSSLCNKDLTEKQKCWSLGGKIQTEPKNKITLCNIHTKSPKDNGVELQKEEKQLLEISLSDEKQWHDINVYLGLDNCSGSKQPGKLGMECHHQMERSETSCCPKNESCLTDSDLYDSNCCHPSNLIIEAPGHMSDVEWMNIFKPAKVQRIVRHKTMCTCSGSLNGAKYKSSASEFITTQLSHCLGSSDSVVREDEREAPPEKKDSPKDALISKDAVVANKQVCILLHSQDDVSPTSKLQHLLAESRQMVTDLELSTLLPISCEKLSSRSDRSVRSLPLDSSGGVSVHH